MAAILKNGKILKNLKLFLKQNFKLNFLALRHHLLSKCRVKNDFFLFFKMAAKAGMCLTLFLSKPYAQITRLVSTKPSTNSLLSTKLCVSEF